MRYPLSQFRTVRPWSTLSLRVGKSRYDAGRGRELVYPKKTAAPGVYRERLSIKVRTQVSSLR